MSRMKVSSSHDRLHVCRTISLLERHLKETVSSSLLIESGQSWDVARAMPMARATHAWSRQAMGPVPSCISGIWRKASRLLVSWRPRSSSRSQHATVSRTGRLSPTPLPPRKSPVGTATSIGGCRQRLSSTGCLHFSTNCHISSQ